MVSGHKSVCLLSQKSDHIWSCRFNISKEKKKHALNISCGFFFQHNVLDGGRFARDWFDGWFRLTHPDISNIRNTHINYL